MVAGSVAAGGAAAEPAVARSDDENREIVAALTKRLESVGGYTSEGLVLAKLAPDAKKAEQFIDLGTGMLEKAVKSVIGKGVTDRDVLDMLPRVIKENSQKTGSYKALFACLNQLCLAPVRCNSMSSNRAG